MKQFKTQVLALAIACSVISAVPAIAQRGPQGGIGGGRGQGQRPDPMVRLTEALSLNAKQQSEIKPVMEKFRTQMRSLFQDQSLSQEAKMSKMQAMGKSFHSSIRGFLNADQKRKLDAMPAVMMGGGGRGVERMKANLAQLGLNPHQKSQVNAILADWQKQMQAAGQDRSKMRPISEAHRAAIMKVLTPAQQQKLQSMAPPRGPGGPGGPDGRGFGGGGGGAH